MSSLSDSIHRQRYQEVYSVPQKIKRDLKKDRKNLKIRKGVRDDGSISKD